MGEEEEEERADEKNNEKKKKNGKQEKRWRRGWGDKENKKGLRVKIYLLSLN